MQSFAAPNSAPDGSQNNTPNAPQPSGHGLFGGLFGGGGGSVPDGSASANQDYGSIGGGRLLGAASFAPGPIGMAAGAANLVRRGFNTVNTDQELDRRGEQPLGPGQTAGSLLGLNGYGSGNAGTADAIGRQAYQPGLSPMAAGGVTPSYGMDGGGGMPMGTGIGPATPSMAGGNSNGGANNPGGGLGHTPASTADNSTHSDGFSGREGWATGGEVTGPISGGRAAPPGLVRGSAPGTADTVMRQVPFGSFVIPAASVSAMGGGNTAAGAKSLQQALPHVAAHGGPAVDAPVSSGEMVVSPQQLAKIGGGDPRKGMLLLRQMLGHGAPPLGMAPPPMAR